MRLRVSISGGCTGSSTCLTSFSTFTFVFFASFILEILSIFIRVKSPSLVIFTLNAIGLVVSKSSSSSLRRFSNSINSIFPCKSMMLAIPNLLPFFDIFSVILSIFPMNIACEPSARSSISELSV